MSDNVPRRRHGPAGSPMRGGGAVLCSLELENFLLFEKTSFSFEPGLNAVSGETGAGKSLVARALGLALGGRGGQDIVRSGCEQAVIRAVFQPAVLQGLDAVFPGGNGTITVERTVRREGAGGLSVNGRIVTAQMVRKHLAPLVDFAAQNEQMRLADPAHQLELLDAYGRLGQFVEKYQTVYREAETLARRLKAGREERELVRLRLERAREELEELNKAAYDPASDPVLEAHIREASNAAGVVQAASQAAALLEAGEPPALEALSAAWKALDRMAEVSPRIAEAVRDLEEASDLAAGALARLSTLSEEMDADPARLDAMITRSEMLKSLARRLECAVTELPAVQERLQFEIEDLAGWDAGEEEIRARLAAALPGVAEAGLVLARKRREASKKLARAVNRELAGLGMEEAGFEVVFEPLWQEGMPAEEVLHAGPNGLDEAGFYIRPNPGEVPSAVAGGVSGGEASRAMLALKAALSEVYRPGVMFLDEVDAGVGSRLGRELGVKLRGMAETRQVIVITHLPQIAAHAAAHLKVAKRVRGGRTAAGVVSLTGEERVREIASMIHGSAANEVTVCQAREMLQEGGSFSADS